MIEYSNVATKKFEWIKEYVILTSIRFFFWILLFSSSQSHKHNAHFKLQTHVEVILLQTEDSHFTRHDFFIWFFVFIVNTKAKCVLILIR